GRWLRSSSLVVVTVFGTWMGWNLHQVRQRDLLRERILSDGGIIEDGHVPGHGLPLTWSLFGEQPVKTILLDPDSKQARREVENRFFEAEVVEIRSPYLWRRHAGLNFYPGIPKSITKTPSEP